MGLLLYFEAVKVVKPCIPMQPRPHHTEDLHHCNDLCFSNRDVVIEFQVCKYGAFTGRVHLFSVITTAIMIVITVNPPVAQRPLLRRWCPARTRSVWRPALTLHTWGLPKIEAPFWGSL